MVRRRPVPDFLVVPWGTGTAMFVFLAVWFGIQLLVFLTAQQLAGVSPFFRTFSNNLVNGEITAVFTLATLNVVAGLLIIKAFLRRYKLTFEAVGWRKFNFLKVLTTLILVFISFAFLAQIAFFIVSLLIPGFDANQAQSNDFTTPMALQNPTLSILALVIFPPIIEETVFRGFLFPAFAKRWGVVFGAFVSSAIFGIAHLQPNIIVYTFVLGLLLCWLYARTKSIVPGMLLHMVNNGLALLAMMSVSKG